MERLRFSKLSELLSCVKPRQSSTHLLGGGRLGLDEGPDRASNDGHVSINPLRFCTAGIPGTAPIPAFQTKPPPISLESSGAKLVRPSEIRNALGLIESDSSGVAGGSPELALVNDLGLEK